MTNFLRNEIISINGDAYEAKYYQNKRHNGETNYSVEVVFDDSDRIILDDMLLEKLEWKLKRILYYAVFSRKGISYEQNPPLYLSPQGRGLR